MTSSNKVVMWALVIVTLFSFGSVEARKWGGHGCSSTSRRKCLYHPRRHHLGSPYSRHCNYHRSNRDAIDLVSKIFSLPFDSSYFGNFNSLLRRQLSKEFAATSTASWDPPYWMEDFGDAGVELSLEVPGVSSEDIIVEVQKGNVLLISGRRLSRQRGSILSQMEFSQTFQLEDDIDVDRIEVMLSSGILTVIAPRNQKRATQNVRIPVKVTSHNENRDSDSWQNYDDDKESTDDTKQESGDELKSSENHSEDDFVVLDDEDDGSE